MTTDSNLARLTVRFGFRVAAVAALLTLWAAGAAEVGHAQEIPAPQYFRYVPLDVPRIIRQTPASASLYLYGDRSAPGYVDAAPQDGIDDRRYRVLQALAVRFAPFLVQNSEMIPMDFREVWGGPYPLHVDSWNTGDGSLSGEETIDWMTGAADPCTAANPTVADCRLLDLLRKYDPDDPGYAREMAGARDVAGGSFEVLWADMPGDGEKAWKDYWRSGFSRRLRTDFRNLAQTFVHPFLEEVRTADGFEGVQLVLQYWFFYPYNDGGNNHEGDWEHIHVVVSPRRLVGRPGLSAPDMRRLLDGDWLEATGGDELVMKRIDYYFHSNVAIFDFGTPNAYAPRDEWKRESDALGAEVNGEEVFRRFVRRLAWRDEAETVVNTHPVGYIGADNKGLDQLLSAPGGTNRDSHGTYPMPGLFKDIGPAGASETIANFFDHRAYYAGEEAATGRMDRFERGGVILLADSADVTIVPDYERVIDLVLTDPQVRQAWSWLVLPLRFGYPAVRSPFAGVVGHAETGNLAVVGPAFNTGWNRSGSAGQYAAYVPHILPRLFPTDLQDAFVNDWGYFNAAVPVTFLPPFDILWRVVAAPVRAAVQTLEPTLYPRETIPLRFIGIDAGVTKQDIPLDYQELFYNPEQIDELLTGILLHLALEGADSTTVVTSSSNTSESVAAPLFRLQLFIGEKFTTTNAITHFRSRQEQTLRFNNIRDLTLTGDLNWWEYSGSVRYNVLTGTVKPYAKAGYGLSWYRLENVAIGDLELPEANSPWVRKPGLFDNLLPNTWHFGAGLELLAIRGYGGLPGGLDLGLAIEWLHYTNKLGVGSAGVPLQRLILLGIDPNELPRERWVGRDAVNLTATLSY